MILGRDVSRSSVSYSSKLIEAQEGVTGASNPQPVSQGHRGQPGLAEAVVGGR